MIERVEAPASGRAARRAHSRARPGWLLLLVPLSMMIVSQAWAARGIQLPLGTQIERSALIAQVTVLDVDPLYPVAKGAEPVTRVSMWITDVLQGDRSPSSALEVFLPGGIDAADGSVVEYAGLPQLEEGERYLVFLAAGSWTVTPFTNWRYSVLRHARVFGKDVMVDVDGRPVESIDASGFGFGERISPRFDFFDMLRKAVPAMDDGATAELRHEDPSDVVKKKGAARAMRSADVADRIASLADDIRSVRAAKGLPPTSTKMQSRASALRLALPPKRQPTSKQKVEATSSKGTVK